MQLVSIYGRNDIKFCITLFCSFVIFSLIYLMIQCRVEFLSKQNGQIGLIGKPDICSGCNLEHIFKNIIVMFPENYSQNKCLIKKLQAK